MFTRLLFFLRCPGGFRKNCVLLQKYTFYLAFENSNCREYITEKAWWNAYHNRLIPIILGPSKADCAQLLPPGSYIHVDDHKSPYQLAQYLLLLIKYPTLYLNYFEWRNKFQVKNEHGYFGSASFQLCRICEAFNYNNLTVGPTKDFRNFWTVQDCV